MIRCGDGRKAMHPRHARDRGHHPWIARFGQFARADPGSGTGLSCHVGKAKLTGGAYLLIPSGAYLLIPSTGPPGGRDSLPIRSPSFRRARVPDGEPRGRKGPRRAGKSWAVRTSVRLVVLHTVVPGAAVARAQLVGFRRGCRPPGKAQRRLFNIPIVAARQPRCQPPPSTAFLRGGVRSSPGHQFAGRCGRIGRELLLHSRYFTPSAVRGQPPFVSTTTYYLPCPIGPVRRIASVGRIGLSKPRVQEQARRWSSRFSMPECADARFAR